MAPLLRPILAVACCLFAVTAHAAGQISVGAPKDLPALAFETMDGEPASIAALKGKVVVLNLWATWCAPCREEMPSLDRLQAAFDPEEVAVVALSVDRAGPERVRAFLDEIGIEHLTVYRDPKAATTRALRIPGLPATLLIDRNGREVGRVLGIADWGSPEAIEAVRAILAQDGA
jgi:thiol-disulfide isomerase/thioredoxin